MSSLNAKDRVSLCLFTYQDGRRCRTPRIASHPHFCFYHAQKESQVRSAATLGKDLAYFFSGNYLSACDLSTALSRFIPAVIRGEIKPRLARTVAYMMQTFLQSIHLAQDEYINAFSPNSACANPSATPSTPTKTTSSRPPPQNPTRPKPIRSSPIPANPLLPSPRRHSPRKLSRPKPKPHHQPPHSSPLRRQLNQKQPRRQLGPSCNLGRRHNPEQPRFRPLRRRPCDPERSEGFLLSPAAEAIQPNNPTPPAPPRPRAQPGAPNRDPHAVHYGPEYRLIVDGKPW